MRLIVVGEGPLRRAARAGGRRRAGVADRVTFAGGVDDEQLVELYAGALAVVFPPFDEDYGYVTLEAFLARKPVVTTTDAGGPLEFVEDGVNGLVVEPDAGGDRRRDRATRRRPRAGARSLGDAGFERARADHLGRGGRSSSWLDG